MLIYYLEERTIYLYPHLCEMNKSDVRSRDLEGFAPLVEPQVHDSDKHSRSPGFVFSVVPEGTRQIAPLQVSASQSFHLRGMPPGSKRLDPKHHTLTKLTEQAVAPCLRGFSCGS
jgi:hypothetical protein